MGLQPSKGIPYKKISYHVKTALDITNVNNIISVGSGSGEIENFIEKDLGIKIICVDPLYSKNIGSIYHRNKVTHIVKEPDYDYVETLMLKKPNVISDNILMLMWPLPNESKYDIEAIYKLKPKAVILYYDISGGAGGNQLQKWLVDITCYEDFPIHFVHLIRQFELEYDLPKPYKILEYAHIPKERGIDMASYTLLTLIFEKKELIEKEVIKC